MAKHEHSWSCLTEVGGKLYCTEEKTGEGRATLIQRPKKSYPAKPLLFPKAKKFTDIFENWQIMPASDPNTERLWTHTKQGVSGREKMQIGPYLDTGPNLPAMNVDPHPRVLDAIKRELILVDNDRTYYKLNSRGGGKYLVSVHYGRIIGSRWLAIIDGKTIPRR